MAKDKSGDAPGATSVFAWWRIDGPVREAMEEQSRRLRVFAEELQSAYGDGSRAQLELTAATSERLAGSVQALAQCRKPEDFIAAEAAIANLLLASASAQMRHLFDFSGKIHDCCAAAVRDAAEAARAQTGATARAATPAAREG